MKQIAFDLEFFGLYLFFAPFWKLLSIMSWTPFEVVPAEKFRVK